jgi:GT2 family glycosyltransferase
MKTIEDIGYFDENFVPAFYEDNDYHNRIKLAGGFARRITRAPYYHFGSVTARSSGVTSNRAGNIFYFKWNATPEECMDGKGWKHPYNEGDKDWRYWYGCDKYTVNTR